MDIVNTAISLNRRMNTSNTAILWNKLSVSQKFSTSSLTGFGYVLTFIRDENTAVLICDDNIATIDLDGCINTSPKIAIR
ncbi:MAG: hypothetical protein MJK12_02960 [Colwellia sp.]|nr:hypothetical protein [Colwellia sp.]